MLLDGYWKSELKHIEKRLSFWSRYSYLFPQEYVEHKINCGLLYSAAIIRKIAEDEKDAEKKITGLQVQAPPFPILKITVPVRCYRHIDEEKLFANSVVFLEDYDMSRVEDKNISLFQVCNQIIHSYAWAIVYQRSRHIYGVLIASDRFKDDGIYLLTISDWRRVVRKAIDKSNI